MRKIRGFTLIELILVIVIIGVLSAVALPKFQDFRSDAKLAAVQQMKVSLEQAMRNGYLMCKSNATCSSAGGPVVINGASVAFWGPYPDAVSPNDIRLLVNYSGFTIHEAADSTQVDFRLDTAADPSHCYAYYHEWPGQGTGTVTTGC